MILNFNATRKEAAEVLGVSVETIKHWERIGKLPLYLRLKTGYKIVSYCLPLLRDWQQNPDDLQAQARAIAALQNTRPSNAPQKRGRKVAA